MNRREYKVTVSHPTNYHSGEHLISVDDACGRDGFVFCGGKAFGCSRDYAASDESAIRSFLREHACEVTSIVRIGADGKVIKPRKARMSKRKTRDQLAELLAKAMNLLNDVDRDGFTDRQIGEWHELAHEMPEAVDYMNNGTVMAKDL